MIKVTIQNRLFKITTNKKTYTVNAPNKVSLYAQSGGIDYANMTLDTSPADADVVPVNGTRNSVLSQLKISLANIKSYVLGTLFNASSGHDHDGTDSKKIAASNVDGLADYFDASSGHDHDGTNSKKIAYANVTDTPAFETSASNIKADGTASAGNSGKVADAAHIHPEIRLLDNDGAHNSIWRGTSLGTSVTTAQWEAISNGTFENMYIGDYWTINDVVWRIWHFNYYYNVGDTNCTTNHVTIVPDTNLYNAKMNDTDIVTGAYAGSKMRTTNLDTAKTTINNAFGSAHILNNRILLANAVSDSTPTGWAWYDSTVELMTEHQVYGARAWGAPANNGYSVGSQNGQFAAAALNHRIIHNRDNYWLQDVVSAAKFALVGSNGNANGGNASASGGVRPAFSIIG